MGKAESTNANATMGTGLSKEGAFFIYLLEHYAAAKGRCASDVLAEWDALHLTEFIFDLYELYHVECLENAYDDIDRLVAEARER